MRILILSKLWAKKERSLRKQLIACKILAPTLWKSDANCVNVDVFLKSCMYKQLEPDSKL